MAQGCVLMCSQLGHSVPLAGSAVACGEPRNGACVVCTSEGAPSMGEAESKRERQRPGLPELRRTYRDLDDLEKLASENRMQLARVYAMPTNNLLVVWAGKER